MGGVHRYFALIFVTSCLTSGSYVSSSSLPLQVEEVGGFPFSNKHNGIPFKKFDQNLPKEFLPTAVTPAHYNLHIRPILDDTDVPPEDQFTAPGSLQIVLNCQEDTTQIVVHKDPALVVNEDSIHLFILASDGSHGDEIKVVNTTYDEPNVFYKINLDTPLQAGGNYELNLDFTSQVYDGSAGLYRGKYETPEGVTKWFATTQFQSYGARMAFPCFDEPGLKATFSVSIARRHERNSLHNTVKLAEGIQDPLRPLPDGWVWDVYNRTVPMSSYLVAMIVSEFVCEEADSSIFDGRPVRVCGPPHQIVDQKGGVFSAESAARTMKHLEDSFRYPYEMFKMDNAAIPTNYFAPGAMENWGLVTYGDSYLLFFDGQSTETNRYGVWSIQFHELGHQWFGDLVTCKTWGHVWLNEGFATYVSFMIDGVAPEFDTQREFLWEKVQVALNYDVNRDEPVYNEAYNSGGNIIYGKGASLLRMVEGVLGKSILFDALADYLAKHAYQPVTQDQFFEVLTQFAQANDKIPEGVTMKDIMDTWTVKAGYPLIKINKVSESQVEISQERYLPAAPEETANKNGHRDLEREVTWEVPIAIATADNPDFSNHTPAIWMNRDEASKIVEVDTSNWIFLNPDAMSFIRVLYDDQLLALLHEQLAIDLTKFSGLSRSQLIDDYFSFAQWGHSSIEKALALTQYLANDNDHIVWYTVFTNLGKVRTMFESQKFPEFSAYLMPKAEAVLDRLLAEWASPLTKASFIGSKMIFTSKLLDWACSLGSQKCAEFSRTQLAKWVNNEGELNDLIPTDFAPVVFCHGLAAIGSQAFDFLIEKYATENVYSLHKPRFLNSLACASGATLQNYLLEKIVEVTECTQNCLTLADAPGALRRIATNPGGRADVISVVLEHVEKLKQNFGEANVAGVATTLGGYYNTVAEKEELQTFVDQLKPALPTQTATLDRAVTTVQENIQWMTDNGEPMREWFASKI